MDAIFSSPQLHTALDGLSTQEKMWYEIHLLWWKNRKNEVN